MLFHKSKLKYLGILIVLIFLVSSCGNSEDWVNVIEKVHVQNDTGNEIHVYYNGSFSAIVSAGNSKTIAPGKSEEISLSFEKGYGKVTAKMGDLTSRYTVKQNTGEAVIVKLEDFE